MKFAIGHCSVFPIQFAWRNFMNIFANKTNERQKFIEEFSDKVGDTVIAVDMAELRTEKITYDELKLEPPYGEKTVWGLAVFCEKGFYFYVSPSESFFTAMMRTAAHASMPKDQLISLHTAKNLKAALPKANIFSRFSYEYARRVDFSFSSESGMTHTFTLFFSKKADEFLEHIKRFAN